MPPSDDLRHSSPALRPEGPQQDEVKQLLYAKLAKLQAWRDDHREHERFRAACDIAVEDLKEIIHLQAALSASRTAQAPQQEGVDLTPIKARQKARSKIEHLHGSLCLTAVEGQQASNDCAELITEIERHRARIQVLETSVDYLRYLVDHPVKQDTKTEI